ncbi:MAG: HlyC/CorC family transporter [Planctomycetes bacterium]|nr:HlyC/CorC family transporter [Planctomycetota bacterium]
MDFFSILADFPGHLATMLLLLGASAFFSASETALFNLSREQLRRFRASGNPLRVLAARLMDKPGHVLVTVLFCNMIVNTAFFAMGVQLIGEIGRLHPQRAGLLGVAIGVLTPLAVIIFGEITPKSLAATMPEFVAPLAALPLKALGYVARPVRVVLGYAFVAPLTRLITGGGHREHSFVTTEELQAIIESAAREGAVSGQESDMLADVLDLGELRVREVMTPRVEIFGCDRATPMPIVLAVFRRTRHSKIVVYDDEMDNLTGVVYAKTVFLNPEGPLDELVRPIFYVPETKTVESLLREFRARKSKFAAAVDEYGGVSGIVTLEDCLEQIVGEIRDETDAAVADPVQRIGEAEYLLAGDLSIRSWADSFDLEVPEEGGRYSTVAGFVTALLGRMPRQGDAVEWRNLEFIVEEVKRRRVTRVRLRLRASTPARTGRGHPAGDAAGQQP